MFDEQRLVWRCKRGSSEALGEIYQRYKQDMLSLATAMIHEQSLAEDAVHDVFVSFAEHVSKLRLRTRLRSYLLTSVANRIRSLYRSKACRNILLENDVAGTVSSWPEQAAMSSETAGLIRRAMEQLPEDQRETIILRLEGRLKFKEIAGIQEVSINTVNSRYRYGLEKLRSLLDGRIEL